MDDTPEREHEGDFTLTARDRYTKRGGIVFANKEWKFDNVLTGLEEKVLHDKASSIKYECSFYKATFQEALTTSDYGAAGVRMVKSENNTSFRKSEFEDEDEDEDPNKIKENTSSQFSTEESNGINYLVYHLWIYYDNSQNTTDKVFEYDLDYSVPSNLNTNIVSNDDATVNIMYRSIDTIHIKLTIKAGYCPQYEVEGKIEIGKVSINGNVD